MLITAEGGIAGLVLERCGGQESLELPFDSS